MSMRQVIALIGCLSLFLQACTAVQAVPEPPADSTTGPVQIEDTASPDVARHDESRTRIVLWTLGGALLAAVLIGAGGGSGSSY